MARDLKLPSRLDVPNTGMFGSDRKRLRICRGGRGKFKLV